MESKKKDYDASGGSAPITINACGQANPPSATISIQHNGGAKINAAYACTLVFTGSCPFANASGNNLSLSVGDNEEPLKTGVTQQSYSYSINPPKKQGESCPPTDDPFDVVVGS